MHALRVAADGLISPLWRCMPIVHGPDAALRSGFSPVLRMTAPIVQDLWRVASGRPRRYIPIVGHPVRMLW